MATTEEIPPLENVQGQGQEQEQEQGQNENEARGESLFDDLTGASPTEIESMCMNCHENGVTRLLLTKIPFFKEVILMAFSCPHCNYTSSEIQSGGSIQETGIRFVLKVEDKKVDLNRQVVKSDSALIRIPNLEFEIPPSAQKGSLKTIEGFISTSIEHLEQSQPARRAIDPASADKIDAFIVKLQNLLSLDCTEPFLFILEDTAGNSFLENPHAPKPDPKMQVTKFNRTKQQDRELGLNPPEEEEGAPPQEPTPANNQGFSLPDSDAEKMKDFSVSSGDEVMSFPGTCPSCYIHTQVNMFVANIPHFKECIIMATRCDACGYRSNEVKAGGAISEKGRRHILSANEVSDLSRDVLKAESAAVVIPELNIEVTSGTLGGRFTTVEGMLGLIYDDLAGNPFIVGDSKQSEQCMKLKEVVDSLAQMQRGEIPFTFIVDDPMGNSFVQNMNAPDPDPKLKIEEYTRTWQQNEDFGINDMNC